MTNTIENFELIASELKGKGDNSASLVMNNYVDQYIQLTTNTLIVKKILQYLSLVLQFVILVGCAIGMRSN